MPKNLIESTINLIISIVGVVIMIFMIKANRIQEKELDLYHQSDTTMVVTIDTTFTKSIPAH